MKVEKDFEDFIKLINKFEVKYLIVGAFALALFVEPRNTGDIDFFIERSKENAKKILKVLIEFGFESLDLNINDFTDKNMVIQLGVQPVRIDILSSISGVNFQDAYSSREEKQFGKTKANFISKEYLIINKRASARKKDLLDLDLLLKKKK